MVKHKKYIDFLVKIFDVTKKSIHFSMGVGLPNLGVDHADELYLQWANIFGKDRPLNEVSREKIIKNLNCKIHTGQSKKYLMVN